MGKPLRKVRDRYSSALKSRIRYCKLCDKWKQIAGFEKYGLEAIRRGDERV